MKPTSNLSNLKTYPIYLVCKEITTHVCILLKNHYFWLRSYVKHWRSNACARWYYKNARRADARQRARASLFERLRGARLYMKRAGARALTRARGKYMARVTALG